MKFKFDETQFQKFAILWLSFMPLPIFYFVFFTLTYIFKTFKRIYKIVKDKIEKTNKVETIQLNSKSNLIVVKNDSYMP